MARIPNSFVDPRTGISYAWPLNHARDGAEENGLTRSIEHGATTGGIGVVRQQGALSPMTLSRRGTILDPAQHDQMVAWAELGQQQTIYFYDASGDQYEVVVTSFRSKPEGVVRNSRVASTAPQMVWRFTLEMEVVSVLAGTWTTPAA